MSKKPTQTEADLTGADAKAPQRHVDSIGGRKLKPSTLMMGHGFDPMLSEGSLKPPIFLTSTFVFPNAAAGKRHFEGVTGKISYVGTQGMPLRSVSLVRIEGGNRSLVSQGVPAAEDVPAP